MGGGGGRPEEPSWLRHCEPLTVVILFLENAQKRTTDVVNVIQMFLIDRNTLNPPRCVSVQYSRRIQFCRTRPKGGCLIAGTVWDTKFFGNDVHIPVRTLFPNAEQGRRIKNYVLRYGRFICICKYVRRRYA